MEEKKNIYESISAIIADCPAIAKAQKNPQQGFMYRGIDAVMNVFQPLLAKHHVFVVPEILHAEREERETKSGNRLIYSILTIRYTFYAEDGSYVFAVVQGEGMDSADKSSNKAMSVAFKYALFQVFCIPTEEMRDPDAESHEESRPARKKAEVVPIEAAPLTKIICEDCGSELQECVDQTGKVWVPEDLKRYSVSKSVDGKCYCQKCLKNHLKASRRKAPATVDTTE